MNIYFLVEGKQTEKKVYPQWLSIILPEIKQVNFFADVDKLNYKLFTGNGFPHLLHNHLRASIEDVNSAGNHDYFVICLDSDDFTVKERIDEILEFMLENNLKLLPQTKLKIIVQQKCIESWLLGNRKIFKANPQDQGLIDAIKFYDVSRNDPELMEKPNEYIGSIADFHFGYLRKILQERNISYTKRFPRDVTEEHYLKELIIRSEETDHLQTFRHFIEFCKELKSKL